MEIFPSGRSSHLPARMGVVARLSARRADCIFGFDATRCIDFMAVSPRSAVRFPVFRSVVRTLRYFAVLFRLSHFEASNGRTAAFWNTWWSTVHGCSAVYLAFDGALRSCKSLADSGCA